MLVFIIYLSIVTIILLCILSESFRKLIAKIIFGSLAVALLTYAGFALQDAARAEDTKFYRIVAIVTSIENSDWDEADVIVKVDDLDNLWDYYEAIENIEFDADKEMEDMALRFIVDYSIQAETLRENALAEGRIVVIDMWTCGTDNIEDDEILGVYYTEFIAL